MGHAVPVAEKAWTVVQAKRTANVLAFHDPSDVCVVDSCLRPVVMARTRAVTGDSAQRLGSSSATSELPDFGAALLVLAVLRSWCQELRRERALYFYYRHSHQHP